MGSRTDSSSQSSWRISRCVRRSTNQQKYRKKFCLLRVPIEKLNAQLKRNPNEPHKPTKLYRKPSLSPHERSALQALRIPTKSWDNGQTRRVKVRGETRDVYISKLTPKNIKLVAEYHKKSAKELAAYLDPSYVKPKKPNFERVPMKTKEYHRYRNISPGEFYDELEKGLLKVNRTFRFHISLGYMLTSLADEDEDIEWYPSDNTRISDDPYRVYSHSDIKRIVSEIRSLELADKLNTSGFSSSYRIHYIDSFDIEIFYTNHKLGAETSIPKAIKDNRHVFNFPKTENKCVFHCIAFHTRPDKSIPPHRIIRYVKTAFKRWCEFNGWKYTLELYRSYQPIDILEFDRLEECFQLNINTFAYDKDEFIPQRRSQATYEATLNILRYKGHAMYITNPDRFLSKYQCPKCQMMLATSVALHAHKKNQCQKPQLEWFVPEPTVFRPAGNTVQSLLSTYKVEAMVPDYFLDHYIIFDFESIQNPIDEKQGVSTQLTARHGAVSVSVCNSLDYQYRFFEHKDVKELLREMMEYIHEIAYNIQEEIQKKFAPLFKAHKLHWLKHISQ